MKAVGRYLVLVIFLGVDSASAYTLIKDNQGVARKWFSNQMPVTYRINTSINEPSVPGTEEFQEIRNGAAQWPAVTSALTLYDAGSTGAVGTRYDQQNTVTMQDTTGELSGNTLAATFIYMNGTQTQTISGQAFKNMTDCDIIFADGWNFGTHDDVVASGCVDDTSVWAVSAHEFGHLLGLDHSGNGSATMFASIPACSASKESLAGDDINGIRFIYPSGSSLSADFVGSPLTGAAPLQVQFTDQSSGSPTNWLWSFGDSTGSYLQNPQHTYNNPGTYTVQLTASRGSSSDTETKVDYITVTDAPPNPDFTANPTIGGAPLAVQFTNQTTGNATNYSWSFGDGTTSGFANPTHSFAALGTYTVSLTATGPGGSATETKVDYIQVVPPPTPDFVGSPTDGLFPLAVSFSSLTTGNVSSVSWDFGDGNTSTATDPQHTYTAYGTFDVSLTAAGPGGTATETKLGYVTTHEVIPDFEATPRIGQPPLTVQFGDLSLGSATGWQWDFGDGGTSTLQNPSHDYLALGRYDVSLTVTGPTTAESLTRTDYVLVSQVAPANLITGPGPDPQAPPQLLAFDALAQPDGATDIQAYGVPGYGVNAGGGDLDGTAPDELLSGPGPGAVFGPQVRAFRVGSAPVSKVNFYAYGTLRFGVAASGTNLDGDVFAEMLSAAGPGAVFGPHVRGWSFDAVQLQPLARVNFFAYATLKYGVNVGRGLLDSDSVWDILTAPGPGSAFGPQVRAFRLNPGFSSIAKINFFAFPELEYGGRVDAVELDADGFDELLVGRGPGPALLTQTTGFDFDDASVAPIPSLNFESFSGALYGVEPHGGDLDGDTAGEIVVSRGADPAGDARARAMDYAGATPTPIPSLDFIPYATTSYGLHVAVAELGF